MTEPILIAYATRHGSTLEVARFVATTLKEAGLEVDLRPARDVGAVDGYGAVVVAGALYTGRWHPDARHFLVRHRKTLSRVPVAVFGMGPQTMEPDPVAQSRAQLDRALAKTPDVEPVAVAIFGGVVDPAKLRFPLNRMPASDARDWDAIRAWAHTLAASFARNGTEVARA